MIDEKRYYFDANALFKRYTEEEGSLIIKRLISNSPYPILVSELTLLECFGVAMQKKREGIFKLKKIHFLYDELKKIAQARSNHFELIAMPEETFKVAHEILLNYAKTYSIGSNDALHLAIVKKLDISSTIMITSDNSLKIVCEKDNIHFYDPETAPLNYSCLL